ncbi:hypothetical protein H4S02_001608 [Coemansia sp. RSA 2611]|nr:hypothetical protein H4S02_001608 [Coemansia sp. RSA 2611]
MVNCRLVVAVAVLVGIAGVHGLVSRATSDQLRQLKGGVLVKDGRQTSCNLAVIDSQAALTSADCINVDESGALNATTAYAVYLDDGLDGKPAKYDVESIDINPQFNATNLVNNLAVLQFNSKGPVSFQNVIAPTTDFSNWDELLYVRYSLKDVEAMEWDAPAYASDWVNYEYNCQDLSVVYMVAVDDMMCTNKLTPPPANNLDACPVPYELVLGLASGNISIIGIYMMSAVKDGDLCENDAQYSYYTALGQYCGYIRSVIGRDFDTGYDMFHRNTSIQLANYSMPVDSFTLDVANVVNLHGDLFVNQTSIPLSDDSEDSAEDGLDSESESTDSAKSGGSNHKSIIIGVCVSVGSLLLICAALYYWSWRRRQGKRFVGHEDMLTAELGEQTVGANNIDHELPPVYEDSFQCDVNAVSTNGGHKPKETKEKLEKLP